MTNHPSLPRGRIIRLVHAVTLFTSLVLSAFAADTKKHSFNIPAESAEQSLKALAAQSGREVIFVTDTTKGVTTPALQGEFTVQEALDQLLTGTPLVATQNGTGAIKVRREVTVEQAEKNGSRATAGSDRPDGRFETDANGEKILKLDTFEVFGRKTLNMDIRRTRDDIQPYIVLDREKIERSGATDFEDLLRKNLPAMATTAPFSYGAPVQGNVSSINLRGLGPAQTLILIDGHRASSYAGAGSFLQTDLNSIPLAAVERVEVLPVSASGIYGGSATGGVVNLVLKRDYSGASIALNYDNPFQGDASTRRIDFSGGYSFKKTTFMVTGTYSDRGSLVTGDRGFYERGLQTLLRNNPAIVTGSLNPPLGSTTNIKSSTGVPLTLKNGGTSLNSSFTYVPLGYAGIASDGGAAFLQNAGKYNLARPNTAQGNGGLNESLVADSTLKAVRATIRQEISSSVSAFLELSGSKSESAFHQNVITSSFVIPSTATNNPFNQNIRVTTPTFGADRLSESSLGSRKLVTGLILRLPWQDWTAGIDFTYDHVEMKNVQGGAGIAAAGSAAVTTGTIDVLRDTNINSPNFGPYGFTNSLDPVRTILRDASLRVGGPVYALSGGNSVLSFQAERMSQYVSDYTLNFPALGFYGVSPARDQTVDSAYAELKVPVFGETNAIPGIRLLELQFAGRADRYTSNSASGITVIGGVPDGPVVHATNRFNSFVPTVGLRISPIQDIVIRASYSEGFLPPDLSQLVPSADQVQAGGLPTLLDPRRGNAPITTPVTILQGGNPDLRPETSASKSVGIIVTPRMVPGLRFSWDWVKIAKRDNISTISLIQDNINNESLLPGFITRAPAQNDGFPVGPITVVNGRWLNLMRADVEAVDWTLGYTAPTERLGTFSIDASATQTIHNRSQTTVYTAPIELATLIGTPRWSATSALTWEYRYLTVTWSTRYYGSYWYNTSHTVDVNYANDRGSASIYHDIYLKYHVRGKTAPRTLLSGVEVICGIKNIFNTWPGLQLGSVGGNMIDPRVDPRLATYYVSIRKSL